MQENPKTITKLASKYDWTLHEHQKTNFLLIFKRDKEQVNVWYTRMTIATVVDHPKRGRQQLYRKHISLKELEAIFKKPRQHTGKGYRQKWQWREIFNRFFGA